MWGTEWPCYGGENDEMRRISGVQRQELAMTVLGHRGKTLWASVLGLSMVVALSGCSAETPRDTANTESSASAAPAESVPAEGETAEPVEIPVDTPAGEESQRILDLLNAEDDTTADDWEGRLHSSFTAEVSTEELVELFNQNLRPAQPFTAVGYEGGDRQAVTTLNSPVSAPVDMTITLDSEGLISGLFFGESASEG